MEIKILVNIGGASITIIREKATTARLTVENHDGSSDVSINSQMVADLIAALQAMDLQRENPRG